MNLLYYSHDIYYIDLEAIVFTVIYTIIILIHYLQSIKYTATNHVLALVISDILKVVYLQTFNPIENSAANCFISALLGTRRSILTL